MNNPTNMNVIKTKKNNKTQKGTSENEIYQAVMLCKLHQKLNIAVKIFWLLFKTFIISL